MQRDVLHAGVVVWGDSSAATKAEGSTHLDPCVVAIALVQAAVIGTLLSRESAQQVPLTGEPGIFVAANMAVFTVAFKPQADEQAIRELLNRANAQIVAGPTSLGLFRIAVPREGAAAAMVILSTIPAVVESVQRDR